MKNNTISNFSIGNQLDTEYNNTTGENYTNISKTYSTVDRADVACTTAYMLGIPKERLEEYYMQHHQELLKNLYENIAATTIRYLSEIRTIFFKNWYRIDNEIIYEMRNIDQQNYFNKEHISKLQEWNVDVVQSNYKSEKYTQHITKLIDENIDKCKTLFPDIIRFEYIKELFVISRYNDSSSIKKELNKYIQNKNLYPFQVYINWKPTECGNILYNDAKFLKILYAQHKKEFDEQHKYHDASDDTKENIFDFINQAERVVMVVDCENADPYKLYGVLKNLDKEQISLIDKITLYDDCHTSIAWDYIGKLVNIPIEHIVVDRLSETKSLVDIKMAVGVTTEHYKKGIDSFILCSSDSDFWGLISSMPSARFLVMYEYKKCGAAIKEALASRDIFYCSMDDFYMANAEELKKIVLKKVLESSLPNIIGKDGWELTRQIYSDSYILATDNEMERFYEKYVKQLKLKIDNDGKFYIAIQE